MLGEQVVTLALTAENTTREATFTVVVRDRFVDVADDNQFALEINWLAARGISTGWTTPAGQEFRPVTHIARDAMAAFIYRLAGSPAFEEPETSPFVDVAPGDQFYREITWLAEQEITTGWTTARGAEFRPLAPIARDAMAAFLYRYADEPAVTLPETSPFTDVTPSTQFYADIAWMGEAGISTGFQGNDGTAQYQPLGPVNRDAMAAFLFRYQGYEDQLS
ncbi:S-layer homology domain-containing protein [Serinibacter arcticus]|uniref:S-layer homology domain-containing protein n=1 Tax=Serinibacter arcticus TaxID=1655435 RepID=UPI001F23CAB5|nr:S-layer homology domain-containing protein [Serinibacter arcticus]